MPRNGLFSGLLASVFEQDRTGQFARDTRSIVDQSRELILARGETATLRLARSILSTYRDMDDAAKLGYFQFLLDEMDVIPEDVISRAATYRDEGTAEALAALLRTSEPLRQEYFRRLNTAEGATATLVSLRLDLLRLSQEAPELKKIDLDLVHLFASWFNRGFLVLRRIDWTTPAQLLEKIIEYEAVHQINDWDDLRRRTQPQDRRCYAYFHPRMPEDPLIFVEIALTQGVPDSIHAVLSEDRSPSATDNLNTAVFYSISNCQPGLQGISFGESLIKHVVADLADELTHLKTFITLSPIPGLRRWVESQMKSDGIVDVVGEASEPAPDPDTLRAFAAHFLADIKRSDGQPKDSVARFHLSNGAQIHNVLDNADLSENGVARSFGVMANYKYNLGRLEANSDGFVNSGTVALSRRIQTLKRQGASLLEAKGNAA